MDLRERQQNERERVADERDRSVHLYRDAVQASPAGALERTLWLQADAWSLLQRRHDSVARDGYALDREDDQRRRDHQHVARQQAEVDQQIGSAPASTSDRSSGRG